MTVFVTIDSSKEIGIHAGDTVNFSTPLYKVHKKAEQRIEIAEVLSINPQQIFSHIKKAVGDSVALGELIAEKKSLFNSKQIFAEMEGVIKEIDHIEGIILIETKLTEKPEYCWFAGEVVSVTKRHVELKIGKHHSFPVKNLQNNFGGETYFFKSDETIPKRPVGIAREMNTYDVAKLEALNGAGFITISEYKEQTDLPYAQFKTTTDFDEVTDNHFSYCLTQSEHSTIIFYSP